jgi:hypothetical protein
VRSERGINNNNNNNNNNSSSNNKNICKIIFHVFYYIMHYNDPPAWGLGEGLTTPHRKKTACYAMLHSPSALAGSCENGNEN